MPKITLQVTHDKYTKRITIEEIEYSAHKGKQIATHPDCYIFLDGRWNDMVSYNLQLALQDRNMPVRALRRITRA